MSIFLRFLALLYLLPGITPRVYAVRHDAAAPAGREEIDLINPLQCSDFSCAATKIIGVFTTVAAPIVAVMVLIGGFQILTAAGDPEKFSKGKKTILYAAVGFVVILLAQGVVGIINDVFS